MSIGRSLVEATDIVPPSERTMSSRPEKPASLSETPD